MGKILIYYNYVTLENPNQTRDWQYNLCQRLGLKGRIILAHEGINGTIGGSQEATETYKQTMLEHPLFKNTDFKETVVNATDYFPRLRVVVKKEIVHLGLDPAVITAEQAGNHLNAAQVHELIQSKPKDLVILDGRNNYESYIGSFTQAINPDIETFRELPTYIDKNLDLFKDKQVVMYCTSGVRCERASAYLKSKGVTKAVYQITGGIQRYVEQFPDGFFRGKNYVFDGRVTVKVNDDILASCLLCSVACDDYTNCLNASCNRQYVACTPCLQAYNNCCSTACQTLVAQQAVPLRPHPTKIKPT
jgi:predicted sulfurtransferase